jgi:DNA-binding NarL/FixJ family response regulator
MEGGAMGFLHKRASAQELCQAIRAVSRRQIFLGPVIAKLPLASGQNSLKRTERPRQREAGLTSRGIEVLQLIAEGKANKQTAEELGISMKTVEKHRQRVMQKLHIHDIAGLTRYAIGAGIIESSVQLTIV